MSTSCVLKAEIGDSVKVCFVQIITEGKISYRPSFELTDHQFVFPVIFPITNTRDKRGPKFFPEIGQPCDDDMEYGLIRIGCYPGYKARWILYGDDIKIVAIIKAKKNENKASPKS